MHYYNSGQGCVCMLFPRFHCWPEPWSGGGDNHSPHVAEEVLVHPPTAGRMQDSMPFANQHCFPVTVAPGEGHAVVLRPEDPQVGAWKLSGRPSRVLDFQMEVSGLLIKCLSSHDHF